MTKKIFFNISLVLLPLLIAYLILEIYTFNYLPEKVHGYLPEPMQVLWQESKSDFIPLDYIALVGDSYAFGNGDDYPHGTSQQLIYEETDIDVISFAQGGVGTLRGFVAKPINKFRYLKSTGRHSLADPKYVFAYFYEGNDLNNNIHELGRRFDTNHKRKDIYDRAIFTEFLESVVIAEDKANTFHWMDRFLLYKLYGEMLSQNLQALFSYTPPEEIGWQSPHSKDEKETNRVYQGKEVVEITGYLQSPALELTEDELSDALQVFEQSLNYLASFYKNSPVIVVYIPSPLTCYNIAADSVTIEMYHGGPVKQPTDKIRPRHEQIRTRIEGISKKAGIDFLDPTPALQELAKDNIIHGPNDWFHFNKQGYAVVAKTIANYLKSKNAFPGQTKK